MRYHVIKKSRTYSGVPYCGPTNDNQPAESDDLEDAKQLAAQLSKWNPVGFDVIDSTTKEYVREK